jgi:8-oxo-dGTP diphosphatase
VAYIALVETQDLKPQASSWASATKWHSLKRMPKLAFDHKDILHSALDGLKDIVLREPIWTKVLPEKFTLTQLQEFYETILGRTFDKGNFRKKVQDVKYIQKLDEMQRNVNHRPSALYRFDEKKYNENSKKGFLMDI